MMEELILIKPVKKYENQVIELLNETNKFDQNNPDMWAGYSAMQKYNSYTEWLKKEKKELNYQKWDSNKVHASTFFSVRKKDDKIIGIINIRHELNNYLEEYGGHIGYSIRYTERKKGYGRQQLLLGLKKCLEIPLKNVLITCRESNIGSSKTIISCGGVYQDTRFCEKENDYIKRYWIKL